MNTAINGVRYLWTKTNRWHKTLLILILIESKLIPGSKYGFRCQDPALSHPFTGDTISWKWLMAVCVLLPLPVMLLTERLLDKQNKERAKNRALRWYREYLYGFLFNLTLVQVLKLVVGSPRPHFFDTCKPVEASTCNINEFVKKYTCTTPRWSHQSDQSFPSGHTSLAIHASFFLIYYIHRRCGGSLWSHCVQALSLALGVWCAASRVTDRRHHWWDVLAGAIIGVLILGYVMKCKCNDFVSSSGLSTFEDSKAKDSESNDSQSSQSLNEDCPCET